MNPLSEEEKKELLKIARTSITEYLKNRKIPSFSPSSPALLERKGAFVTLKKAGFLRGCIGMIEAINHFIKQSPRWLLQPPLKTLASHP